LRKACEKRPVPQATLEGVADDIEKHLQNRFEKEVASSEIGEIVMNKLFVLDEVAYVRFASVYRQFKDIHAFTDILGKLQNPPNRP
jgi:transcriptional repressor NrdR